MTALHLTLLALMAYVIARSIREIRLDRRYRDGLWLEEK